MADLAWQAAVQEGAAAAQRHRWGAMFDGSHDKSGLVASKEAEVEAALRAAVATLKRHGYVLVPKVATAEMLFATGQIKVDRAQELYAAMLAAAPAPLAEETPHGG